MAYRIELVIGLHSGLFEGLHKPKALSENRPRSQGSRWSPWIHGVSPPSPPPYTHSIKCLLRGTFQLGSSGIQQALSASVWPSPLPIPETTFVDKEPLCNGLTRPVWPQNRSLQRKEQIEARDWACILIPALFSTRLGIGQVFLWLSFPAYENQRHDPSHSLICRNPPTTHRTSNGALCCFCPLVSSGCLSFCTGGAGTGKGVSRDRRWESQVQRGCP
jgi:hypothetical protein